MEEEFNFFQMSSRSFEDLAATVIQDKYQIPLLSFSEGRDGGRDAAIRGVKLRINGETFPSCNVAIQVKHTRARQRKMDSSVRQSLLHKELSKVKKLTEEGEVDTYFIVTNYKISALQEKEIVKMFGDVGCQTVVVVGYETLVRWIRESESLKHKLWKMYGIGGPNLRDLAKSSIKSAKSTDKKLMLVMEKVDSLSKSSDIGPVDDLVKMKKEIQAAHTKVIQSTKGIESGMKDVSNPLRSIRRSVSCTEETLHVLSEAVQNNQKTLLSLKRKALRKSESDPSPKSKSIKLPGNSSVASESVVPEFVLQKMTEHPCLLRGWKFVARSLGVSEADILLTERQYSNAREQVYQVLKLWLTRACFNNRCECIQHLISSLRQSSLNAVANELVPLTTSDLA